MPSTKDTQLRTGLAVLSVVIVLYSLIIVQQILLGLLAVAMLWGVYLFYHLVVVLARIASALEQIALQRADGGTASPPADESVPAESEAPTDGIDSFDPFDSEP